MTEKDKKLTVTPEESGQNTANPVNNTQTSNTAQNSDGTVNVPSTTPGISQGAISDESYNQAISALQNAQKTMPTYAGTYETQLKDIYDQIVNRDKFKYDLNADMLYQQYKDQYVNMGQMAMKDTMGQAAALTGGYGSTYGQSVGQQQYDAYLKELNNVVPELYGMAYDQYQDEGAALMQQYGMLGDMADDEYGKYQDSLNQYWRDRDYNYSNLTALITSVGYSPTADEIAAAGMTQEQVDSLLSAWKFNNPDLAYKNGTITAEEYKAITGVYPRGYTPPSSGGGGGDYYTPPKNEKTEFELNYEQLLNDPDVSAAELNSWLTRQPEYMDSNKYDDYQLSNKEAEVLGKKNNGTTRQKAGAR